MRILKWDVSLRPAKKQKTEAENKTFSKANYEYQLADLAYKNPAEREKRMQDLGLTGTLLKEFNQDEFFAVKMNDRVYNVHRGSVTQQDWTETNTKLATNELEKTDRFKRSLEKSNQTKEATGLQSVEVGHSLGGSLAEHIALRNGDRSVVFNQGTTPLRNYTKIDRNLHQHFRIQGDGVSSFDPTATVVNPDPKDQFTSALAGMVIENTVPGKFGYAMSWLMKTGLNHTTSNFSGK